MSGPDCFSLLVLKNCQPEFSYMLTELFNICWQKSCFPHCWKVSSVVPVFENVGGIPSDKFYHPVSLFSVVSKIFEKLVNNRLVDSLEKSVIFTAFHYGFSSS